MCFGKRVGFLTLTFVAASARGVIKRRLRHLRREGQQLLARAVLQVTRTERTGGIAWKRDPSVFLSASAPG